MTQWLREQQGLLTARRPLVHTPVSPKVPKHACLGWWETIDPRWEWMVFVPCDVLFFLPLSEVWIKKHRSFCYMDKGDVKSMLFNQTQNISANKMHDSTILLNKLEQKFTVVTVYFPWKMIMWGVSFQLIAFYLFLEIKLQTRDKMY